MFQVQFPGITGGNLMYVEEKLFRKKTDQHHHQGDQLTPGQPQQHDHVVPWENSIILEGNKIFTLTGLRPSAEYRLRWLAPDRQYADVMVTTRGESESFSHGMQLFMLYFNLVSLQHRRRSCRRRS